MICRAFMWRNEAVAELEGLIENEAGLKKGGELSFEVDNTEHWKWFEFEPIYIVVGDVEIIGYVLGVTTSQTLRKNTTNPQVVVITKVSIKQNPMLARAFNQTLDKTTLSDPEENVNLMNQVEAALVKAGGLRDKISLDVDAPPLEKRPPPNTPIEELSLIQLASLYKVIVRQNEQQQKAITQLQDKYDKMNAEVKELVENYIPDLSSELSDES